MEIKKIRNTPEIVIPKGYGIDDLFDFDDGGYFNYFFIYFLKKSYIV